MRDNLIQLSTVRMTETENTEGQKENTVATMMAEKDFNQNLVRVTRTVILNQLFETSTFMVADIKGNVKIYVLTHFEQG